MTAAMREADRVFEKVGGSTRHHVRDCLLPILNRNGWAITRTDEHVPALKERLAAADAERSALRQRLEALSAKWRKSAANWLAGIGDNQNTRLYREVADELDAALAVGRSPESAHHD